MHRSHRHMVDLMSPDPSSITTEESKYKRVFIQHIAIACPNPECKGLFLEIGLLKNTNDTFDWIQYPKQGDLLNKWQLLPNSRSKPQPDYIPEQIRKSYLEACLICDLSPMASAALSRRCLQGIVRDFWIIPKAKRGNLGAELNFIKDRIDDDMWKAIQTIRSVGDIGAHMEKDVNYIVDVEPDEAELLIELIETLLDEWYVARKRREDRSEKTRLLGEKKLEQRKEAKKLSKAKSDEESLE